MQEQARKIVMEYFNSHVDKTDNKQITLDDDLCSLDFPKHCKIGKH